MLQNHKKQLLKEKKEKQLLEVIREENEIQDTVKGILYWTYNNSHPDLSKGHIIAGCKKNLDILKHPYKKKKINGPSNLTNFTLKTYVDKPKHLAKVFGPNNNIAQRTEEIMNLVDEKFSFNKNQQKKIFMICKEIFKELGVSKSELDLVFEFIGVDKP